jgi:hypothetical protein
VIESEPARTTFFDGLNWTRSPGFMGRPDAAQRPGNFALNVMLSPKYRCL